MAVPIGTEELAFRAAKELDICGIPSSEGARKIQSARRLAIERPQDLAPYIEHTALKPETTRQAVNIRTISGGAVHHAEQLRHNGPLYCGYRRESLTFVKPPLAVRL